MEFTRVAGRHRLKVRYETIEAVEETRTGCFVHTRSGTRHEVEGPIDQLTDKIDRASSD